jgi:hypothetical protein
MTIRAYALAAALTLTGAAPVHSQTFATDKAVWQVGGNVHLARSRSLGTGTLLPSDGATTVSLAPRLGYFLLPGLALTGNLSLSYTGQDGGHSWSWGGGPGLTYYFGRGTKSLYPYVAGITQFSWLRSSQDDRFGGASLRSSAKVWQLSGGAVVMVARNVGLNGELYYSRSYLSSSNSNGLGSSNTQEDYGLQFGVSLFVY